MTVQQTLPRPAPPPAVQPPPPPRPPRSVLGRVVLFASAVTVGVVGMVDLAGVTIGAGAYLAAVLAVIGTGLLIGAWYGRARWLIAAGAVAALLLGSTMVADTVGPAGPASWQPAGIEQLDDGYQINIGNAVLDLSAVDFTGQTRTLRAEVNIGDLQIILPPSVDAIVQADVRTGNAQVLGTSWGGMGQRPRAVTDNGIDGTGGGQLTLYATVHMGNLEVRR